MTETTSAEHFDVLIVGGGISGVGGAYHLTKNRPGTSLVVLENQESFGGTWLTHTYPGVRSDSDLYTFGYEFKPWTGPPIATAQEILTYMGEVIEENDLAQHIRYSHEVKKAEWSGEDGRWTLTADKTDTGEEVTFTCNFLYMCQGYYNHKEPYTPEWPGMDRFEGQIVHPQLWPDDLDYKGKKVVCIGSGATAATIIPAMAPDVEHITMVQRSPTYFVCGRNADELADQLRELEVDETWIHEIIRRKRLKDQDTVTQMARDHPDMVKEELFKGLREILGEDFDLSPHFTPKYRPWRQRLAFVPDGDLFHAVKDGKASAVTGEIETFTETGLRMEDGEEVEADIILTATGFNMNVLGDIEFDIDGAPLDWPNRVGFHGTMFSDIPNLAWVFGYFRASWTLRADMIAKLVCRLLDHMDEKGAEVVTPKLRSEDEGMERLPWVDPEDFNPGYISRAMHILPKQGDRDPWRHTQDYWNERKVFPVFDLDDGLVYE
ncbi:MAG: NAD(P)/FAD-dependent oxidoreductase [Actinomycetia bacterium]|nr:NAD(P)/FAD-dependent oxidoreductase [Actinomycetes bacterium]MCP4962021.1 NAD(P)/FAD-dependent oxidoreductase [Actinomycetes bacterium]